MSLEISREAFESADDHTKQLLIFDMLQAQSKLLTGSTEAQKTFCTARCQICDTRMKALEGRKFLNGGLAAGGGFVGGFVAMILKIRYWG